MWKKLKKKMKKTQAKENGKVSPQIYQVWVWRCETVTDLSQSKQKLYLSNISARARDWMEVMRE